MSEKIKSKHEKVDLPVGEDKEPVKENLDKAQKGGQKEKSPDEMLKETEENFLDHLLKLKIKEEDLKRR